MNNLIECEPLDNIAKIVGSHVMSLSRKKSNKVDKNYYYNFHNMLELRVVYNALNAYSLYVENKKMPFQHPERTKEDLIRKFKDVANDVYNYGLVDEYHIMMSVYQRIETSRIASAHGYVESMAKNVFNELIELKTKKSDAQEIVRFVKDAILAIAHNRKKYEDELKNFNTFLIENTLQTN